MSYSGVPRMPECFDTDTLNLGRRTPRTPAQRLDALRGIERCNQDVHARELTTSDEMIKLGWSAYRRAGYELRWHELMSDSSRSGIPRPERSLVHVPFDVAVQNAGDAHLSGRPHSSAFCPYELSRIGLT